jgi:Predicted ribosomal protein
MIKAKVRKVNQRIVCINITGHSGYSEEGSDIVCSAVTAMASSIGDGIVEILKITCDCVATAAHIKLDIHMCSEDEISQCQVLLETLYLGLKNVEKMYGEYIRVIDEEV